VLVRRSVECYSSKRRKRRRRGRWMDPLHLEDGCLLVAELVWEMLAVRVMFQLTRKVETWGVPS